MRGVAFGAGTHALHVTLGGQHVRRSPMPLLVAPGGLAMRGGSVSIHACEAGFVSITALGRDLFGNDCASAPHAVGAALLPAEGAGAALSAALRPKARAGGTRSEQAAAAAAAAAAEEDEDEGEEEEEDEEEEEEGEGRRKGGVAREAAGVRRMRATLLHLFGTAQVRFRVTV